jgi:tetratricopeptide (TPR) repeat protein
MTDHWNYHATKDKLRVFVSSRIEECEQERSVAQDAIFSLNHHPVLFEHLGAKSYSPRDLYLSRLRDSQVMIGIYRCGYGFVDVTNGMAISGIHDEYEFAQRNGIDCLFYILRTCEERESALSAMLDTIQRGPYTVSFYDDPKELGDRIRDDLTALITEKYLRTDTQTRALQERASVILLRATQRTGVILSRQHVVSELQRMLGGSPILCIWGPPGIGKTTLAAQLAIADGAVFVRLSGLAPIDVFSICARALRGERSDSGDDYSNLEASRAALVSVWAELKTAKLVVDECNFAEELIDALAAGGGVTNAKQLVFTSREESANFSNFEVPALTRPESETLVQNFVENKDTASELIKIGNPLQLHHALLKLKFGSLQTDFAELQGPAGEILRYLSISPVPLSAENLLELRGDDSYLIDNLYEDIRQLGGLVEDTNPGFRLMHSETASKVASELQKSPQRYRFFTNRLIRLFESLHDFRRAYDLASKLNDGTEKKYTTSAIRQAVWVGDWRFAVTLMEQMLQHALDAESKTEAFHLMLSLVYPLELMGEVGRAAEILQRAEQLANGLGESEKLTLAEVQVSSRARQGLTEKDVEALKQIYAEYGERQEPWDQARVGLELSALYIAAKEFEQARDILLPTVATFEGVGDEYGLDLAQRNLASALSGIPGNEAKAEEMVNLIEARSHGAHDSRRQRAWLCNLLTRRLRQAGRYEEAEKLAKEAVELGGELSDEYVRAINLINLGNNYRDQDHPLEATEAYQQAAIAAQKCGRRDVEADSSRLTAGIYNDFHIDGIHDCSERALAYAQHAIGLLRDTLNHDGRANALWELADAHNELGNKAEATKAYFEAALEFSKAREEDACQRSFMLGSNLALPDHPHIYIECLAEILAVARPDRAEALPDQFITLARPIIESAPRGALISLLSQHLHEIWTHVPAVMRRALITKVLSLAQDAAKQNGGIEGWRILYAGIVLCSLLKETRDSFLGAQLARLVTVNVTDLFARQDGASQLWTVVLELGRRVVVTIVSMDDSPETALACSALAMFLKSFELDLNQELIANSAAKDEVQLFIGHIDHFPDEVRKSVESLGVTETLRKQSVAVTRPTDFSDNTPTWVTLSPRFNDEIIFGEGKGGSLQILFGLVLTELTFQLLKGQVESETIRPKVVSLVRRTI